MSFYTRVKSFLQNTLARGSDVRFELDAIASGMADLNESLDASITAVLNQVAGAATAIDAKVNYAAGTAPTVNDDSDDEYGVGSRWIDTTNDRAWVCLDASVGAAVWRQYAPAQVSSAERTAGTETALRAYSPADVASMITTHAPGATPMTRQIFTSGATWTRPSGCRTILVRLWGGGGCGGGTDGSAASGAGGGAGYSEMLIDVTSIASSTVTIGSGGAGGASTTANGSAGGNSGWSDGTNTLAANGGSGGQSVSNGAANGAGGTASGGDRNYAGLKGFSTQGGNNTGCGGASYGHPPSVRDAVEGVAGIHPGCGGTSRKSSGTGAAGFRGECIVDEFY